MTVVIPPLLSVEVNVEVIADGVLIMVAPRLSVVVMTTVLVLQVP